MMIGKIMTTRIRIAGAMPGPCGWVEKKGSQPKVAWREPRMGLRKGSITKMAHNPKTTDGIAASNSTIIPMIWRAFKGIKFSVRKIAVPTPSGTAIKRDKREVARVP